MFYLVITACCPCSFAFGFLSILVHTGKTLQKTRTWPNAVKNQKTYPCGYAGHDGFFDSSSCNIKQLNHMSSGRDQIVNCLTGRRDAGNFGRPLSVHSVCCWSLRLLDYRFLVRAIVYAGPHGFRASLVHSSTKVASAYARGPSACECL